MEIKPQITDLQDLLYEFFHHLIVSFLIRFRRTNIPADRP